MKRLKLLLVVLVSSIACSAQDPERMDQVVQSYVIRHQFMGAVLVAHGSDIVLSKGYGSANLEWEIPNTSSTKFRLGSLTKQFTAAAILLLEERGKLKVEDLVKVHFPEAPAAWEKITIFNLLTHTSGIPDYTGFPELAPFRLTLTPEQLVATFSHKPLDFEPGQKWKYSNSGYVLLGYLIERMGGESYATFLQKNIFVPLGMKNSGYDSSTELMPQRASGYDLTPAGFRNTGFMDMSTPFAAGGLYSTTKDLLRWELGLFGGKLLSEASLQKMITPFRRNYAFGLGVDTEHGPKLIGHSGGINGFQSRLAYYPDGRWTIIVLSNLSHRAPDAIADDLEMLAHGGTVTLPEERKAVVVRREILEQYAGRYGPEGGPDYFLTVDGDQLMTQPDGAAKIALFPESDTKFFLKGVDVEVEFRKDDKGKVTHMVIYENDNARRVPRKAP